MEVGVAVGPGSVLVQTGEAGEPQVIAIVRPRIGVGQFTVNGKGCHGEDAESHLPHMVVGDVVFQAVDIVHVHAVAEDVYKRQVLNNSALLHADNSFVVMTKFRSSPQKVKYQDFTIRYTTPF